MEEQTNKLKKWLILFNVALSVFMATLDSSIVNIALPVISKKMMVNISSIQWIVTSYLLTISVLLLIWGKIADQYGKKKVFAFGIFIFTIGSLLCGFAQNLPLLVFARVLQAVGASATMALSQGIITATFPANERGSALGITGTTVAIGSLLGPSLGGVLVHAFGWQSIFFINVPIGILGTILTFIIIPELDKGPIIKGFDYKGSILFMTAILVFFLGLLFIQDNVLPMFMFIPVLLLSTGMLCGFISHERKRNNPLINLFLFKIRVFSMGIVCAFLSFIAIFSTTMFIPFFLQYILQLDTLKAGLLMSFYPATTAIFAPISGWLSDKLSYRYLTIAGLSISTLTLFAMTAIHANTSYAVIAILMALLGLGVSIFQSPNTSSIMGAVPRNELGIAGGINALSRNLGMVSGVTLSVILFTFTTKMNINNMNANTALNTTLFLKGFRFVMLLAAFSSLIAVIISLTRSVTVVSKTVD